MSPSRTCCCSDAGVVDVERQLGMPSVQLIGSTSLDDVRSAFAEAKIDHVVMGAGLDLETRLQIIREIFQSSDTTTVHLRDHASGPEGFLPFVRSLKDIAQHTSGLNHLEAFPQPSDGSSETTQSLGGTRPGHQHLSA